MELQEGIKYYNRMSAAFDLLKALQEGSEEKNYYLSSLSHKDLLLPDGNIGSLVEFSILMQRYVAALYLIENDAPKENDDDVPADPAGCQYCQIANIGALACQRHHYRRRTLYPAASEVPE